MKLPSIGGTKVIRGLIADDHPVVGATQGTLR
jgi:hypothetical protein